MSVHYDFYQNPPKGPGRRKKLHARVVTDRTVTLDDLAELINQTSTFSRGDVLGAVSLLTDYIFMHLKNSCRIHLEGLGYFEMTLSCPPVQSTNEIRAESVKAKSIVFRPDLSARRKLKTVTFVRQIEKRHSKECSMEDIDKLLSHWFATHDSLTRIEFQGLCDLTRSTATRRLNQLLASGSLHREGASRRYPYYHPGKGYFGR